LCRAAAAPAIAAATGVTAGPGSAAAAHMGDGSRCCERGSSAHLELWRAGGKATCMPRAGAGRRTRTDRSPIPQVTIECRTRRVHPCPRCFGDAAFSGQKHASLPPLRPFRLAEALTGRLRTRARG
jgi:hypothetical protein